MDQLLRVRQPLDLAAGCCCSRGALLLLPCSSAAASHFPVLSHMGIAVVFALSYNMLFGQGGMLSFGHAAFSGLAAYLAIHALA